MSIVSASPISAVRAIAPELSSSETAEAAVTLDKVSSAIRYYLPEVAPFDFQADYLDDWSTKWAIWEKSRQIGFSQTIAFRALMRSLCVPNYRKIFCSLNLDDAKEKIEYANQLYDAVAELETVPAKVEDRKMSIKFSNGSRLISMFQPRGKSKADISLDEFAHYADPRKIYVAALPILVHPGTQLDIGSSPLHSQTMFAHIMRKDGGKYKNFVARQIFWWDSPIHCKSVKWARLQAPLMDTATRVANFGTQNLRELFDNMPSEDFQQEFELKEMDDEMALLSWELIIACTPSGEDAIEKCNTISELKERSIGKVLYAGFDVGRYSNRSELSVFEVEDNVATERYVLSLKAMSFELQEQHLDELMSLQNVRRLKIDKTGLGEQFAERLAQKWTAERVVGVHFTSEAKNTLASNLKMLMEKSRVKFWADQRRNFQMHSIKKQISAKGNVQYNVDTRELKATGDKHHGDVFWSRALGLSSWSDFTAMGRARIRVISIGGDD